MSDLDSVTLLTEVVEELREDSSRAELVEIVARIRAILHPPSNPYEQLRAAVRLMLEIHDRPCEPNGDWPYRGEYLRANAYVRKLIGMPPAKDGES